MHIRIYVWTSLPGYTEENGNQHLKGGEMSILYSPKMFYPASAGQTTPYPSNSLYIKSWWKEERDYRLVYKHKVRQAESIMDQIWGCTLFLGELASKKEQG